MGIVVPRLHVRVAGRGCCRQWRGRPGELGGQVRQSRGFPHAEVRRRQAEHAGQRVGKVLAAFVTVLGVFGQGGGEHLVGRGRQIRPPRGQRRRRLKLWAWRTAIASARRNGGAPVSSSNAVQARAY